MLFVHEACTWPLARSSAASDARFKPPMRVKRPPTYRVVGVVASASTGEFGFGVQFVSRVRSGRMRARLVIGSPPTAVKRPPTIQPPEPSVTTALIAPLNFGKFR